MVSLRGEIILRNFEAPPKNAVITCTLTSKQSNASLKAKVGTEFEM